MSSHDTAATGIRHISLKDFIIRFDIVPVSIMPSAVSYTDAQKSLLY